MLKDFAELALEHWEIVASCAPHDEQVYFGIGMYETIAHADNLLPVYFRVQRSPLRIQVRRCLADDLHSANDCILCLHVL